MDQRGEIGLERRDVLAWLGASAAWIAAGSCSAPRRAPGAFLARDGSPSWTPLQTPTPGLADPGDAAGDAQRLARYCVLDELLVPAGFTYEVLASWGERFGPPGHEIRFGYNNDFLGLVPVDSTDDELWLVVNHEYVSFRPWMDGFQSVRGRALPPVRFKCLEDDAKRVRIEVHEEVWEGTALDLHDPLLEERLSRRAIGALRELAREALGELGISVLRLKRDERGAWRVDRRSPHHKRISGVDPRTPTHSNCSGTVTPWRTALSGEENYQDYVQEAVDAAGEPSPRAPRFEALGVQLEFDTPLEINGLGACLEPPQDGRDFGWVCHVDPASGELEKLRSLGRMRHENVALRCEPGRPLVAYTGDDRRGGHVWKFVSARVVERSDDPRNVRLFDDGTLYVARFHADGSGEWLPLVPSTPLALPSPEHTGGGHLWLPDRSSAWRDGRGPAGSPRRVPAGGWVAVSAPGVKQPGLAPREWAQSVSTASGIPFEALTLGDLVWPPDGRELSPAELERHRQRVLLLDAVAMANAIGATPCARPEDLELHPDDGSVYIAFTDSVSTSSEGSPDARVFPESRGTSSRRYGAIFRLEEQGGDGAALRFRWNSFCSSGEVADGGAGFANPDNLCFDPAGNLWVLTDIPAAAQNAPVERSGDSAPGRDRFAGVFGSSALFMIPTRGPRAGVAHCFAIGPPECELCGVTFSPDGETLFLSVQHPGELHGTRGAPHTGRPDEVERTLSIAARDGTLFEQRRTVPLGSNWPARELGVPPRPAVVAIRRA